MRCTQYEHFSITPRKRLLTCGLRNDGTVELPDGNVVMVKDSGDIVVPEPTLDIGRRRVMRVNIESEFETDQVMNDLMGKDPSARYHFIMDSAKEAEAADLDV